MFWKVANMSQFKISFAFRLLLCLLSGCVLNATKLVGKAFRENIDWMKDKFDRYSSDEIIG